MGPELIIVGAIMGGIQFGDWAMGKVKGPKYNVCYQSVCRYVHKDEIHATLAELREMQAPVAVVTGGQVAMVEGGN